MELIKKTISFDRIRNYNKNRLSSYDNGNLLEPTIDEYTSWGHFPVDIIFKDKNGYDTPFDTIIPEKGPSYSNGKYYETIADGLTETLPLTYSGFTENESGETVVTKNLILRYKVMEERYYLLRNYIENMRFYWLCRKKNKYNWVELKEGENGDFNDKFEFYFKQPLGCVTILRNLPNVASLNYCTMGQFKAIVHSDNNNYGDIYVVVNKDGSFADGGGFKCWNGDSWCTIIGLSENRDAVQEIFNVDGTSYEERFYYFADFFLNKNDLFIDNMRAISSIPYMNMGLYIEGNTTSMGLALPYIEEWIPGKKYYKGDTVKYKRYDEYEAYILTNPVLIEWVEIPETVYNSLKNGAMSDVELKMELVGGVPRFYRRELYYNGNFNYLRKVYTFDQYTNGKPKHWTKISDLYGHEVENAISFSKSRLNELLRYKKSFEEDGGELPFVAIDGTNYSELRYCLGSTKVKYYANAQLYTNSINSISFSHTGKPASDDIIELKNISVIPSDDEIAEYTSQAYYSVTGDSGETLNFYFGSDYADLERHFFRLKNSGISENTKFGIGLKLNNNGTVVTTSSTKLKKYITKDIVLDVAEPYFFFSLQFDDNGALKSCSVDHTFKYGYNTNFNAICGGQSAITTDTSTAYYSNIENNNMIGFDYSIDRLFDINDDWFVDDTGINFVEWHPYTISEYIGNYDGQYSWLEVENPYELSLTIIDTDTMPKITQAKVNIIYHYIGNTITKNVHGGGTADVFRQDHYYRKVSLFYYIKIDYDKTYIYDESQGFYELENGRARVEYDTDSVFNTRDRDQYYDYTTPYPYADESILGITDMKAEVDANIERNPNGVSAFERHNILSEVNTFADLENYKNNFFKL